MLGKLLADICFCQFVYQLELWPVLLSAPLLAWLYEQSIQWLVWCHLRAAVEHLLRCS